MIGWSFQSSQRKRPCRSSVRPSACVGQAHSQVRRHQFIACSVSFRLPSNVPTSTSRQAASMVRPVAMRRPSGVLLNAPPAPTYSRSMSCRLSRNSFKSSSSSGSVASFQSVMANKARASTSARSRASGWLRCRSGSGWSGEAFIWASRLA